MSNDEYQHQNFCQEYRNMKNSRENAINTLIRDVDSSQISDGYHTFGDMYDHRNHLFVVLAKMIKNDNAHHVWRSIKHSDNSMYKGWFIMGINKVAGEQITYHLPISFWEITKFAETLDKAPEFDGHTPQDVIERIKNMIQKL